MRDRLGKILPGHKHSEEVKNKMSKSSLGKPATPGSFKKGHKVLGGFQKGNTIRPLRNGMIGKPAWNRGKSFLKGIKSPRWKGGCMPYWKNEAKVRDNYTCQECGLRDPDIVHIDHIVPKAVNSFLKNDLSNLITLCPNCHMRKTIRDRKYYKFSNIWKSKIKKNN